MKTTTITSIKVLIAVIFLLSTISTIAQGPGMGQKSRKKKEKIKTYKIAFITEKINLTPEEAEKFWPVYNVHMDKMQELQEKRFESRPPASEDFNKLTDTDAEAILDKMLDNEQKIANLLSDFRNTLKPILPPKKILLLFNAEREFRIELMKRLANNKKPGRRQ